MKHYEFFMKSKDGLKLRGQGWEPEDGTRAVVCLVHGIGEHSDRYQHVGEAFALAGYAMLAFDLRGHGRSQGRRGHAPNYAALMSDIALLLGDAEARYPNLPRFLYGHSLGGNLAIHYALKRKPAVKGVIASAPLFRLAFTPPKWKTAMLKLLCAMRINIPISRGVEETSLCRDFHIVRLYQNDPLVHDRITPSLAISMLREGEWNLRHASRFPLPLLLMHGEADRITSPEASVQFAARLEHKCTLKIWDGCYHELHNEPEKDQVIGYVLKWLSRHL